MKSFRLLFSLEKQLLINNIKSILQNPKRILAYVGYLVFMTWIVYVNVNNFSGDKNPGFLKYASGGLYILLFMMAYGMTKKSSIYFKMSEINLLFTAPVDSRKLLMFTMLKRIPVYLLTSVYTLIFLMSMIVGIYHPSPAQLVISCIGYSLVLLILEPLGFCLFAMSTRLRKPGLNEKIIKMVFLILGLITLTSVFMSIRSQGMSIGSVFAGLGKDSLNYLPIIGWGKALTLTSMTGITTSTFVYLGLMLGLYVLLFVFTYTLGTDYYEDVIGTSEERTKLVNQAKEGKYSFSFQLKKKKIQIKDHYKLAGAIYWKKKLLTSKSDISVYFSIETVLCLIVCVGTFLFNKDSLKYLPLVSAGIYFYVKFLFSSNTSLDQELGMHYFYTIPDNSMKKLIQVLRIDVIRFFINVSLISIASGFLGTTIDGMLLVMPFAVTSFYVMMLLSSFTLKLFFTTEDFNRLLLMFKMVQMIVILIPAIIALIVVGSLTSSLFLGLIGSLSVNFVVIILFLALSDRILNRMELK